MSATESVTPTPTEVWFTMNSLVRDHAKQSQGRISEIIDIPFSRFRALRRVAVRPMTQRDLAERMGVDAPAMSGIVNDLVKRGLVTRETDASDGRCKRVTITDAGRRVVEEVTGNPDTAPEMFAALDDTQLRQLDRLLDLLRQAAES
ncbi:MarR family transcriptional regulator [Gordonia sp. zg691]|uniref:MarR family transcriptional regulator n=1 Tax=Gordonia jinghuaiqii TaxID=2758710 RepID=A0A7D7QM63_9ACTN|nr:MarR family transcriptional regulator [Gordonia jinghuaiqii]MBD0862377.1 MarR family transcriptional regulator [Gordonia jinghuaiqii]MCR5976481.1 MarR family transcriptional regulator [Gordonia jinghuaiqii]QMS99685.1 MarR family transcriptional regulator [Gordonia jinghuaiqii]